jgi:hypothetical protein
MNELMVAERATHWHRLKALVLDSVSSPITRRVYNLGLDEFIAWFMLEAQPAGLQVLHRSPTPPRRSYPAFGHRPFRTGQLLHLAPRRSPGSRA